MFDVDSFGADVGQGSGAVCLCCGACSLPRFKV